MTPIEIIEKWNNINKAKQRARLVGAISCFGIGFYLLSDFNFRRGITYGQKEMHVFFPEEYDSMTKKLLDEVEKHYDLKNES